VLVRGLGARYVLVGDDFRFGARRAGTYAMLDEAGSQAGFDVARMLSYEVHGLRVSSSAVRDALAARPHGGRRRAAGPAVQHQRPRHPRPQARARAGLSHAEPALHHPRPAGDGHLRRAGARPGRHARARAWPAWACAPSVEDAGRVLLEVHCLQWPTQLGPEDGYGRVLRVELLHKLHDERHYGSLDCLQRRHRRDTRRTPATGGAAQG
jgi:riboflavin kinase/FMN adenylyltransferase